MHRWRLPLALCACAALFFSAVVGLTACGDSGDDDGNQLPANNVGRTPFPNDPNASPLLNDSPNKYSLLNPDDLGPNWITNIPRTFDIELDDYAMTPVFESVDHGRELLQSWGYRGGFATGVEPEGRTPALLTGGYLIFTETHMFETPEGAAQAYAYFTQQLDKTQGVQTVGADPIGNESKAYKAILGKIPGSTTDEATHELIFRRGNMVVVVVTVGADSLMSINSARLHAGTIDAKALGEVAAPTPTPTTNFQPPTFESVTPSPSASATS